MRVQLGYPWTDPAGMTHRPDDIVDVDPAIGKRLLSNGIGRPAPDPKPDLHAQPPASPVEEPSPPKATDKMKEAGDGR